MKTNILTAAAVSFLTMTTFAQKDQVKNAEDAIEDKNFTEAKAQLKVAEANLSELNDKWQEKFYLYKGKAYSSGNPSNEDVQTAAMAYAKAVELGNEDASAALIKMKNDLINSAIEDQGKEDFNSSAEKLLLSYQVSKQDTVYLYYAANDLVKAQEYGKAVEYLQQLRDLGYDGSGKSYTAVNIETGETESMGSKEQMDLMVKTGQYKDAKIEPIPSKKGEIASLIARIYINEEEFDKAIESMDVAKAENPKDVNLVLSEASMYYQMGEKEKAVSSFEKAAEMAPNDPNVFYNIGVTYNEIGNEEKALENIEKAIALEPSNGKYYITAFEIKVVNRDQEIQKEMNSLGMTKADNKKYDELVQEKKELYLDALPYLEKAMKYDADNTGLVNNAISIYTLLEDEEKVKELKESLE